MREILNSQNKMLTRLKRVETEQIQQGDTILLIFKLLEEMEKGKEKMLEHQTRKKWDSKEQMNISNSAFPFQYKGGTSKRKES